jgi:hypothetical protein
MMLNILNKREATEDEILAVRELSDKLGGLALTIDIIAKQIRTCKSFKSIRDFLPCYDEHRRTLHRRPKRGIIDPYYAKGIDAVWKTAFELLTTEAAHLISLFCFMAPEGILQWILEQKDETLPGWEFLSGSEKYLPRAPFIKTEING